MEKSPAILLRRTALTDTSLIVTWCTETHGIVKTVAKGARRPKSPFAGMLDLFFTTEIIWTPSRRSDLHTLTDATLLDPRLGVRRNYLQILTGSYFSDCIVQCAEPETPIPELFDLLARALDFLNSHASSARAIHHFERQLGSLLGLVPEIPKGAHQPPHDALLSALSQHLQRIPKQRAELDTALHLRENATDL